MTTDLMAGTPLERVELPPNTSGFGLVELLYLLARHPGDRTRTSRELLLIPEDALDVQFALAGRSTLAARGLVAVTADRTEEPRSSAALLEVAMGDTLRWVTVTASWDDGADRVCIFEAPDVTAVVQPRALGTYFASFSDRPGAMPDLVRETVELTMAQQPTAQLGIEVRTPGSEPELLFARASGADWEVVRRSGESDITSVVDTVGRDAAIGALVAGGSA